MLLLVTRHLPKKVHRLAIGLFANIAFITLFYLFIDLGFTGVALSLLWLFVPSTLFLGLLFYHFTVSFLIRKVSKIDKILGLIPFLSLILVLIGEFLFGMYGESNEAFDHFRLNLTYTTLSFIFPLFNLLLIVKAILHVRNIELQNQENHSNEVAVNLRWSKYSILMYSGFIVGMVLSEFVPSEISEVTFNASLLLLVFYIGFYEVKKITQYLNVVKEDIAYDKSEQVIIENDLVEQSRKNTILFNEVDSAIEKEMLFLNVDLSVALLSNKLSINGKYISQSINECSGMNFNNYVNFKRIEYAKGLLRDSFHKTLTIEGISNKSGFRSKSTFNATFKKLEGDTPTHFIKGL